MSHSTQETLKALFFSQKKKKKRKLFTVFSFLNQMSRKAEKGWRKLSHHVKNFSMM
jgi:hypothetical protein